MPLVSVVIPTYNRQELVQHTIDSVLRQSFSDWELIVVDDGSTDDSPRLLPERYGSRIRYVYQSNQGESVARNHGISLATGEYIAFLDSDDLWHPEKLQRQVEILDAYPDVGLVSTQAHWINYEGCKLKMSPHGHDQVTEIIAWEDLVLDNVVAGGGSAAIVRRACLEQTGGFDPRIRFGEEWDLWVRIARHFSIRQIPEPLIYYRLHRFGTRGWAPRAHEANAMYEDHRVILKKAFADCPCALSECEHLESQAVSRIDLRHAIVNSITGNTPSRSTHWANAISRCPEYAADSAIVGHQIVHFVTGYASVAESGSEIDEIRTDLARVLDNLPAELQELKSQRHSIWSHCLAELAFLAAVNKRPKLARRFALHTVIDDAGWRCNRGLWKILITGGRHLWPEPLLV